jgi:hypothetical protein
VGTRSPARAGCRRVRKGPPRGFALQEPPATTGVREREGGGGRAATLRVLGLPRCDGSYSLATRVSRAALIAGGMQSIGRPPPRSSVRVRPVRSSPSRRQRTPPSCYSVSILHHRLRRQGMPAPRSPGRIHKQESFASSPREASTALIQRPSPRAPPAPRARRT